jgi:hypothetical protein
MPSDNRTAVGPDELKRLICEEANAASGRKADLRPSDIALIDGADGWSASFVRSDPNATSAHTWAALARVQTKYRPTHF